jgi:hypothetical protein
LGRIVEDLQRFTYILDREERMLDKISMIIVMPMFWRRTYLGMVSKVDSVVGRIVEDLQRFTYILDGEERSIFNDTIIIFSSDNGGMSEVQFFDPPSHLVSFVSPCLSHLSILLCFLSFHRSPSISFYINIMFLLSVHCVIVAHFF